MSKNKSPKPSRGDGAAAGGSNRRIDGDQATVVWDKELEGGDFFKLPRVLCYLGRYDAELAVKLQPRHILLLLNLAARKYRKRPNRAYWIELATDLGTKTPTVRKWAYELEEMGLLRITRHKGRVGVAGKPGVKNDRNTFDFSPFVSRLRAAHDKRKAERQKNSETAPEQRQ